MTTYSAIRASDSDRESVVTILRDGYTEGRLTLEEFHERTTAALSGRTWGALGELTKDLPHAARLGAGLRRASESRATESRATESPACETGRALPAARAPAPALTHGERAWRMVPLLPVAAVWLVIALSARMPDSVVPVIIALLLLLRCTISDGPARREAVRSRPGGVPRKGPEPDGSGRFR
jgi:hypothetical protein